MRTDRLLTLDGGGTRGLVTAYVLLHLEGRIQQITGQPYARVADYLDYFCGTSTGAIIASLLVHPDKYSAEQVLQLYLTRCREIFKISPLRRFLTLNGLLWHMFPDAPLERVLKGYLGEDTKFSDVHKPLLVTAFDSNTSALALLCSMSATFGGHPDFLLWEVIRSAVAAPSYFSGYRLRSIENPLIISPTPGYKYLSDRCLIDGGTYANNPSMLGVSWYYSMRKREVPLHVLSIGTGDSNSTTTFERSRRWGGLMWASNFIDIQVQSGSRAGHRYLKSMYKYGIIRGCYLRFNPMLKQRQLRSDLGNYSPKYLQALIELTEQALRNHDREVTSFVEKLLEGGENKGVYHG